MSFDTLATPLSDHDQQARRQLRQHLRALRRALPVSSQQQAARGLAARLARLPGMARARHVAAYVSCDCEIDPSRFLDSLLPRGARVWLPVLTRRPGAAEIGMHLARRPDRDTSRRGWQHNRFGIREPRNRTRLPAWQLDFLLLPLVGFDAQGQRLGMGGGFYDRLLADLARRPRRPRLIGLAHDLQQVANLPVAAWDRPVDRVVTATRVVSRAG